MGIRDQDRGCGAECEWRKERCLGFRVVEVFLGGGSGEWRVREDRVQGLGPMGVDVLAAEQREPTPASVPVADSHRHSRAPAAGAFSH